MTTLLRNYKKEAFSLFRILIVFGFVGWLPSFTPELGVIVYQAISDAYVAVSVWIDADYFLHIRKIFKD